MEKISGIIPSNSGTRSVDTSNSQPARPGAPALGRPMGKVTKSAPEIEDKLTLSPRGDEKPTDSIQIYNRTPEKARAKIVDTLAKNFFDSNAKTVARDNDLAKSEEITQNLGQTEVVKPDQIAEA